MPRPETASRNLYVAGRLSGALAALLVVVPLICMSASLTLAAWGGTEAARVTQRLLAAPQIKAAPGFNVRLIVPPGDLYDPLQMVPHNDQVWVNDDGGEAGKGGGRIVAISPQGKVSVLVGPDKMLPDVGMDIAPQGFGSYGGQIFLLTQPSAGEKGLWVNHLIQHLNPDNGRMEVLCALPAAGKANHGYAAAGSAAWFGPAGSPFAGRLFAVTTFNHMIYQATADGKCSPFADFDQLGVPLEITFTPDGKTMLAAVTPTNAAGAPDPGARRGMIMRVSPKGEIDPKPLVWGLSFPGGMAFAPKDFGKYGGQLFFSDEGEFQTPVPMTQPLKPDGTILRLSNGGIPKLVASGFINPLHLRFIGNKLWVSDLNGDFLGGKRELPDGFIAAITVSAH